MRALWALLPLALALQVHAQCRDISSENQRALTIGQQVCFRCPLQGSNFSWRYLDGTIFPSGAQAVVNGTLVISSVAKLHLDPNFFFCQAEGGPLSEPYRLVEASIPPPLLFDKTVNESTDVTVFCTSSARPTPHIYEWTYKGMSVSGNSVLQISRVQRTQAGVYTCTTTNIVGNASATLTLTVQFAPANTLVSDPVVVHQINHTLSCSFDGLPRPTVTWRFNGSTFVTGSDNYVIRESGSMSHVDIVGTKLDNSGEYECEVSNLLGTNSSAVFLTVQVPPFAPTDLSVGAITTTSFQLMWTNPFDGNSPLTAATITLSSTDGSNSFPADTLTSHQFQGLIPNRQYRIEVVVSNAIGSSPLGNVSTVTLPLAPAKPTTFTVTAISSTELQLNWTSPANDPRVSPILSWVVQYRTGNTPTAFRPISDPAARQHTLMGLMKGTVYFVILAGVNSAGQGNFTDEMSVRTLFDSPTQPLNLVRTVLNPRSATIQWEPSADNGGSPLLNYRVELRAESEAVFTTITTVPHPTLEYQLTLEPETTYFVRLSARNMAVAPYGPPSSEISFTTPQLNFPPASGVAPLHSDLTDTSVTISFRPLVGVVTVYVVEYHLEKDTWDTPDQVEVAPTANENGVISTSITGLEPNSPYEFRFFSRNDLGASAPSPVLKVVTGRQITVSERTPSETSEGSDIVLECLFGNGEMAANVTWLLDGRPVAQLDLSNVQPDGHRLTISNAVVDNSGVYTCQYNGSGGAVVASDTQVSVSPTPAPSSLTTLLIIIVSCVAGGGLILLILVVIVIILYCYYKKSTSGKGNYNITNGKSKNKSKSTWIEPPSESDAGMTYLPSSHYPTVRSHDSRVMIEGTPFDYHSPDATDHQPYSTFSTLEHKHTHNVEPRYATPPPPPPPMLAEQNEMHMVSLGSPPPMYGREDMV